MARYFFASTLFFFCCVSNAFSIEKTVTVIVSNADMQSGANTFYVPTMFINFNTELPVHNYPDYVLPGEENVTVFKISDWNLQEAQNTIVNYQLEDDFFSSNCTEPASDFCTDSACTTIKIKMKFDGEAVCRSF